MKNKNQEVMSEKSANQGAAMTPKEAKQALLYHSFLADDVHHPKMENGFLGMLRPFQGELYAANFQEILQALQVLGDDFRRQKQVDKEVMSALWGICVFGRAWAVEPGGMLQANDLISAEQIEQMREWVDRIAYATAMLLGGSDDETAFYWPED